MVERLEFVEFFVSFCLNMSDTACDLASDFGTMMEERKFSSKALIDGFVIKLGVFFCVYGLWGWWGAFLFFQPVGKLL